MIRRIHQKLAIATLLFSLLLCTGCNLLPIQVVSQGSNLELVIETVEPAGRPGSYNLAGKTNLPDDTEITVAAVRYLQPNAEQSFNEKPAYTILSRQRVLVDQGTWKTTLNLWQVAPDGRYREAWQLAATTLAGSLAPVANVTFVALLEPANLSEALKEQLSSENKQFEGSLVRFTPDGETYLQTSRAVALDLPTGKTSPPAPRPEDVNGGWGDRDRLPPQPPISSSTAPPAVKFEGTNAPLNPEEFLR